MGVPMKGGMGSDRGKAPVSSSDPPSSFPSRSSPTRFSSCPNLPPDSEGWQKPTKVACMRSPDAIGSYLSDGSGVLKGVGGSLLLLLIAWR